MKIATVQEMRMMDHCAIGNLKIPEEVLMENAGMAAVSILDRELGVRGKRFSVFCGLGNNGGDGLVVARKIHSLRGTAHVYVLGDAKKYKGAAKTNYQILKTMPVEIQELKSVKSITSAILHSQGIIDAIFGTGLDREVAGLHREAIEMINQSGKKVLSLDIPSGVNGDTGEIMGAAVQASWTVTFGLPKTGNILYPGYELCGKLYVTHISFPPSLYDSDSLKTQINSAANIPPRQPDAHKGKVGDVLFIAGAAGYYGAPYFSAHSLLKAGGGYSRLATPKSMAPFIAQKGSEIVIIPQIETASGSIALANKENLLALAKKTDMTVIGPGLSLEPETQQLVAELAAEIGRPVLIDGDGITAVADHPEILQKRKVPAILTPHLGEMCRITGVAKDELEKNRIKILQQAAGNLNAIIVLKGPHSLIGLPDGRVYINMSGNSGMATAGAGDVLTGTIAAMFGLGLPVEQAVCKGVFIHGLSGDLAALDKGEDGITAQDILDYLPMAMVHERNAIPDVLPDELKDKYALPVIV